MAGKGETPINKGGPEGQDPWRDRILEEEEAEAERGRTGSTKPASGRRTVKDMTQEEIDRILEQAVTENKDDFDPNERDTGH